MYAQDFTMLRTIFFYDQAPNRSIPRRSRKYPSSQVPLLSGVKVSPSAPFTGRDDNKTDITDGLGKKSLLPEINLAYHTVRNHLDSTLTNDEDSQRHLFEQTKASAMDILQRLSFYLYELPNKDNLVPKSLEYQLLCGYEEFTRDVVMVPREWQTSTMRDHVRVSRKKSDAHTSNTSGSIEASNEQKKRADPSSCNSLQNLDPLETSQKGRKRNPSSLTAEMAEEEEARSISATQKSKDRITPRSSVPVKKLNNRSQSRLTTVTCVDTMDNKTSLQQQFDKGINIRFSLASASSWRKGYASVNDGLSDRDREEILKKCVRLLQSSKSIRTHGKNRRLSDGARDYSLIFYGSKIVQSNGSQSGRKMRSKPRPSNKKKSLTLDDVQPPKIPRLESSDTEEEKQLLQSVTNCKTTIIHYKSGRIAIVRYQVVGCPSGCNHPACYYTLVFDDIPGSKLLLVFLPDGTGCCQFKNGHIKLFFSATDGYIFSEHGEVLHHWLWGKNKSLPNISHQVTSQVSLHSAGPNALGLAFKCDSHTFKFNISALPPGSKAGCHAQQGQALLNFSKKEHLLKTSGPFSSSYAKELVKGDYSKQKIKNPDKETLQKEEFRKSLEIPEKVRFGLSAELILLQLKRKARHIVDSWMEHYQIIIGIRPNDISQALSQKSRTRQLRRTHSAVMINPSSPSQLKDVGLMSVSNVNVVIKRKHRMPSAPPGFKCESVDGGSSEENRQNEDSPKDMEKIESSAADSDITLQTHAIKALEHVSKTADKLRVCCESSNRSHSSGQNQNQGKTTPHLTGITTKRPRRCVNTVLGIPCTPALRQYMTTLGTSNHVFCRCSVSLIPQITDLEYDQFIYRETNNKQMIVVVVVSSRFPDSNPGLHMLERVYQRENRKRRHPCVECKNDMFRVLQYDVDKAAGYVVDTRRPLLLRRHNVVPGMVLIYCNGDLLFCDHIFNGYGCAEDDFHHQLRQCHTRALKSFSLPRDFRFSPACGLQGIRTPWGVDIGGAGVDFHGHPGLDVSSTAQIDTSASILTPKVINTERKASPGSTCRNEKCSEKKVCREKMGSKEPLLARRRIPVKNGVCLSRIEKNSNFKNNMVIQNNSRYLDRYMTGSRQRQTLPQVVVTEQK